MKPNITTQLSTQFATQLPMQIVAQLDKVTVFQTAACHVDNDCDSIMKAMLVKGASSYGTLNLGLHVQDDAEVVLQNRMSLLNAINYQLTAKPFPLPSSTIKSLHWVNQVHGQQIYDIDASCLTMQPLNADAMISQQVGVGLAIMTADCVPIVLYQPMTGRIAAIHAGWQGLACGVIKATAARFEPDYPIMAWVGVCISQANYEVGQQVCDKLLKGCLDNQLVTPINADNFIQNYVLDSDIENTDMSMVSEQDSLANHQTITDIVNKKVKLDLPKLAIDQLSAQSITINNEGAIACSYGDSRYYSYRRQTHLQQSATGRMALIIVRHDT